MSYDLVVFDAEVAPRDRDGFMSWYAEQTQWDESHGHHDPQFAMPGLRDWFLEMIQQFPAMNGPYASQDDDDPKVSDYAIGRSLIYIAFAWSQAEAACLATFEMAEKHKLGFFNASSPDEQVWAPNTRGEYECIHAAPTAPKKKRWWRR